MTITNHFAEEFAGKLQEINLALFLMLILGLVQLTSRNEMSSK